MSSGEMVPTPSVKFHFPEEGSSLVLEYLDIGDDFSDFLRLDRNTGVCGGKCLADPSSVSPWAVDELLSRGSCRSPPASRIMKAGSTKVSIPVPERTHEPDRMFLEG
jgi:hypothetical protein